MAAAREVISVAMGNFGAINESLFPQLLASLNLFLSHLYDNYHLDINYATQSVTVPKDSRSVSMPSDLRILRSISVESPKVIFTPTELSEIEFNQQDVFYKDSTGAPYGYFPDYTARLIKFPMSMNDNYTLRLIYSKKFTNITLNDSVDFFGDTALLERFLFIKVHEVNKIPVDPMAIRDYQDMLNKYLAPFTRRADPIKRDPAFHNTPVLAIP